MYRYAQTSDFDEWKIYKDEGAGFKPFCAKHRAGRATVLTVSADPDIAEISELKYAGDFYVDIDSKNLDEAISSTAELCEKLIKLGVSEEDLEIRLSGSKGCHVFVPAKVFSSGRPVKNLPGVYKRLATELYVPGIDLVVYSEGKGRMFRPTNAKRPDGAYAVPVAYGELKSLTAEQYKELVKAPRKFVGGGEPTLKKAPALTNLFAELKLASNKLKNKNVTISDEVLSKLEGAIPPCIEELAAGKERDHSAFNRAALNVACWASKSVVDDTRIDSIFTRIAETTSSKKYDTMLSRKRHIQGLKHYVSANNKYGFSCLGMLSVIKGHPCKECALKDSNGVVLGDHTNYENMFVYANMGQYYSDPDFTKPIASFNMTMTALVRSEGSGKVESSFITITSPISGYTEDIKDFAEDAWTSKQKFKQELQGLSGVAFLGNDNDVAKLRLTVTKQDLFKVSEMQTKYKHSKVGVYYYRRKGSANPREEDHKGKAVYVEPGYSVDGVAFPDSHLLAGEVHCTPVLKKKNLHAPVSPKANHAFKLLLQTNSPVVISTMLGWFLANHLKSHFITIERRYPLLYISGIAGTGKNSLVALWMRIAGLEGEQAMYTLEAPNATKLPFQQGLTNSTTIPRVVNELNPKSVSKSQYTAIVELLKGAFDSQTVSKGRIGGGDRGGANVSSVNWTITAPVVTLSEEPISSPALLQRGIKVELNPKGHKGGSKAFYSLEHKADDLNTIAVRLTVAALKIKMPKVIEYIDSVELPEEVKNSEIPERLKYGFKILLASYDWAIDVFSDKALGLTDSNLEAMKGMRQNFVEYITTSYSSIEREASVNEVDKVLKDIAILAHSRNEENPQHCIKSPYHFVITEDRLYLDVLAIYPVLQKFKASVRTPLALQTDEAFINSARGLDYFLDDRCICQYMTHTNGRPVLELDVPELEKANIPVAMFRDS